MEAATAEDGSDKNENGLEADPVATAEAAAAVAVVIDRCDLGKRRGAMPTDPARALAAAMITDDRPAWRRRRGDGGAELLALLEKGNRENGRAAAPIDKMEAQTPPGPDGPTPLPSLAMAAVDGEVVVVPLVVVPRLLPPPPIAMARLEGAVEEDGERDWIRRERRGLPAAAVATMRAEGRDTVPRERGSLLPSSMEDIAAAIPMRM